VYVIDVGIRELGMKTVEHVDAEGYGKAQRDVGRCIRNGGFTKQELQISGVKFEPLKRYKSVFFWTSRGMY
jgi:hypothetical protein